MIERHAVIMLDRWPADPRSPAFPVGIMGELPAAVAEAQRAATRAAAMIVFIADLVREPITAGLKGEVLIAAVARIEALDPTPRRASQKDVAAVLAAIVRELTMAGLDSNASAAAMARIRSFA
jgi:hypothetical protein